MKQGKILLVCCHDEGKNGCFTTFSISGIYFFFR
ncbi:MAG: hypothetical protein UZ02_AOB001002473 [Nitrosomonas europaea]|nr:MAG: hypothetical protein UZ02_AOB001002473 [Nitrosomonas europaea]